MYQLTIFITKPYGFLVHQGYQNYRIFIIYNVPQPYWESYVKLALKRLGEVQFSSNKETQNIILQIVWIKWGPWAAMGLPKMDIRLHTQHIEESVNRISVVISKFKPVLWYMREVKSKLYPFLLFFTFTFSFIQF